MEDFFKSLNRLYTEQRPLAAIWLTKPVITKQGKTVRIAPEMEVKIENNELVDCIGEPTHKVLDCLGTLYNQFELVLLDLKTMQPHIIKL